MNRNNFKTILLGSSQLNSSKSGSRSYRIFLKLEKFNLLPQWFAFAWAAVYLAIILAIVKGIFPSSIPFTYFELWHTTGNLSDWCTTSWPILAWAIGLTFLVSILTRNSDEENIYAEYLLRNGFWVSLRAGLMEEILFRWLLLMLWIPMVKVINFIFLGFIDLGLIEIIHLHIIAPIANFFTMDILKEQVGNPNNWSLGAAIIIANSKFRDGHKYLGLIGFVNSWFIGMFMFYLLFKYGLVAAIVVHFLYDLFIYLVRYLDSIFERSRT